MRYAYLQGFAEDGRMVFDGGSCREDVEELNGERLHYVHVFDEDAPAGYDRSSESASERARAVAEWAFARHNVPDRPRGKEIRSMSVGDVVVVFATDGAVVFVARPLGFDVVIGGAHVALVSAATRRAYATLATRDVYPPRLATTNERPRIRFGLLLPLVGESAEGAGYEVEASEMGLGEHEWPARIDVVDVEGVGAGSRRVYIRDRIVTDACGLNVVGMRYESVDGLFRLDVLDDVAPRAEGGR